MQYRYAATSLEGFVQQLAVGYVARGYLFYVRGRVPERKAAGEIDRALIGKYDVAVSAQTRARRKRAGGANVHYLRYREFWVLVATYGQHRFFVEHAGQFHDIRRRPFRLGGYSVSHRGGHAHVRVDRRAYLELKCYYLEQATRCSAGWLEREFARFPFEMYAPVRRQMLCIFRAVCTKRKQAGLLLPQKKPEWFRRRQLPVFAAAERPPQQAA